MRLALKLATGAGKTTVMAMLIAWQTVNAVRYPQSKHFTRASWSSRPASPSGTACGCSSRTTRTATTGSRSWSRGHAAEELQRAKIVITNYHAFKLRERLEISKGGSAAPQGRTGEPSRRSRPRGRCSSG
jgi:type III restriction enzyme